MPKVRSPNYPTLDLGAALEAMRPAFKAENRNKFSRKLLAKHLGYSSLNGRALGKIGAVRAYGLIEGSGDELRISDDAVTALASPDKNDLRYREAMLRLALKPQLFLDLRKNLKTLPSEDNLKFQLIERHFTDDAAGKAAKTFLTTMRLVFDEAEGYNPAEGVQEPALTREAPGINMGAVNAMTAMFAKKPRSFAGGGEPHKEKLMPGERELTTGLLAKGASFRLIVSGEIGVKEIERLIQKLKLDKEILAEQADESDVMK